MKSSELVLLGALAGVAFVAGGCSDGAKSPSEVVKAAFMAANEGRYADADSHVSSDDLLRVRANWGSAQAFWRRATGVGQLERIDIGAERVEGTEAVVECTFCYKDGSSVAYGVQLRLEKGAWRVLLEKSVTSARSPAIRGGPKGPPK